MPRETKATKPEKEFRLTVVNQMCLDGYSVKEIMAVVNQDRSEKPGQKAWKAWNVVERTIREYISECRQNWAIDHEDEREHARQKHLARLEDLYRTCKAKGNLFAAISVLKEIKDVRGLAAPTKYEHSGSVGLDFDALSEAELDKIIADGERELGEIQKQLQRAGLKDHGKDSSSTDKKGKNIKATKKPN